MGLPIKYIKYKTPWVVISCLLYFIMLCLMVTDFVLLFKTFGKFFKNDKSLLKSLRKTIAIYVIAIVFYILRTIWAGFEHYEYENNTPINYSQQVINRLSCCLLFLFLSMYLENWLTVIFCVIKKSIKLSILIVYIVIESITIAIVLILTIARPFDKDANSIWYIVSVQACSWSSLISALLFLGFGIACLIIVKNTLPDLKQTAVVFGVVGTVIFCLSIERFVFMGYNTWTGGYINPYEVFGFFNYTFVDVFEGLTVYIMLKKQIDSFKKSYAPLEIKHWNQSILKKEEDEEDSDQNDYKY